MIGIASASLRNGRCHAFWSISASTSRPSRNRITISATTARSCTKPERGSNSSTSRPPWPRAKPASTNSAASDRNDRRTSPATSAPGISSAAEDEQHDLELTGIESPSESSRGRASPVANHRARQVAVLAGRGRSLQRLPDRGGRLPPPARLRQRRVLQAAAVHRLRRRRRGRDLPPARRPLPRPRAVLLRADLRAAPAARPRRPLAGHRLPRLPGAARRRPARPSCSAASSAPGATRT